MPTLVLNIAFAVIDSLLARPEYATAKKRTKIKMQSLLKFIIPPEYLSNNTRTYINIYQ